MAIKFFRKNMKLIMVITGVPIIVAFLLTGVIDQQSRSRAQQAQEIGTYIDNQGDEVTITTADLASINQQIEILRMCNVHSGWIANAQLGISQPTVMAAHLLIFGDGQDLYSNMLFQNQLLQSIAGSAQSREKLEQYSELVNQLGAVDSGRGRIYYLLLAREARRAGIYATDKQVETFKKICQNFGVQPSDITRPMGLTTSQVDDVIATYIATLRHGEAITRSMDISEPQLKKAIRDDIESQNVTGRYVEFDANLYEDKIPEPTPEDLQKQFDAFKSYIARDDSPGQSDQNPHAFGYMLPDRVMVEYLKVDDANALEEAKADFDALSLAKQEDTLLDYYKKNKSSFSRTYDQEAQRVKQDYLNQQSQLKVGKIFDRAAKLMLPVSETEKAKTYEEIAGILTTKMIPVDYDKTEYFSIRSETYINLFGLQAAKVRKGQPGQSLQSILFACEPLQKFSVARGQAQPVKLLENITDIRSMGSTFAIRILAVDKERQALSLEDDGRQGSAENAPLTDGESLLKKQVTDDWKILKAYQMACQKAEEFAKLAVDDFDTAINKTNESLKPEDPNAPPVTIPDGDLERDHTQYETEINQIENWSKQAQQFRDNPGLMNSYSRMIRNAQQALYNKQYDLHFNEAMKLAQEIKADSEKLPILKQPKMFSCRVFENLTTKPPYQDKYLRQRAIDAGVLQSKHQPLYAVIHYNPKNIEKRCGYKEFVDENADDETKEE